MTNLLALIRQLEIQFALASVSIVATRFDHALVGLDEDTIGLASDDLRDCSYTQLKKQLVERLTR